MEQEEYERWLVDAKAALTATQYNEAQADIILDFFRYIKGSAERELVGDDKVEAFLACNASTHIGDFSVYASMMARLWIYAPHILRDAGMRVTPQYRVDLDRKRQEERESYRRG